MEFFAVHADEKTSELCLVSETELKHVGPQCKQSL